MNIRPILFSSEMLRALLNGRKTQTRCVLLITGPMGDKSAVTSPDEEILEFDDGTFHYLSTAGLSGPYPCPYGQPGDLLWVREAFCDWGGGSRPIQYRAETPNFDQEMTRQAGGKIIWRPSIHMPRNISRLSLEITDVRVERLQAISRENVMAEGIQVARADVASLGEFHACYRGLWDSLNAKRGYSWDTNPWVWVITFRPIHQNVDAITPGGAACDSRQKAASVGITRVHAPTDTSAILDRYAPDLADWPESWCYEPDDAPVGERLVAVFRPFLIHLIKQGLAVKTVRRHRDNLHVLGGEIITHLHREPDLSSLAIEDVIREQISDEGGPLLPQHRYGPIQGSFDSTCRKLYRFLNSQPGGTG